MDIQGKTFLVTGGASGLGEACVRLFVERGGKALIADLNIAAGVSLAQQLGRSARFVKTDVASAVDAEAAVKAAVELSGGDGLRGLVSCAGIAPAERVVGKEGQPHSLEGFQRAISVNLVGTFNVLRFAAAAMVGNAPLEDNERGVIVNTASVAAFEGQLGQAAYSASKGGVAAMTLPIARELARHGIRVVAIAPGVFETPMMAAFPDKVQQALAAMVPFPPRLGKATEFAQLVAQVFENRMLNGTTIRLDGAVRMAAK